MAQASMIQKLREFLLGGPALNQPGKVGNVYYPGTGSTPVGQTRQVKPVSWQYEAYRYWHLLGEIRFPTEHLARQVGRLDWDVTIGGVEQTAEQSAALMAEATFGLGTTEASRMNGLNLQVGGEAWYVEVRPGEFAVFSVVTRDLEKLVQEARAAGRIARRVYFPDPVDPKKAESAIQTALGPAEELLTLSALSRAQSRSRIAQAGMLLVASEIEFEDDTDPFGADLERAMEAAISDVNSPAAMVPIKVEIPEDLVKEGVKHINFERPYDERLHRRVEMATNRLALAMDVPAELLKGSGEANHWTAWLTALETYTSHLEPLANPIAELYEDVIETLIQRSLGQTRTVKVNPNPSKILAKRSTIRDALDAAKLGAVGLRYVRDVIGAKDEDKPTEEELEILRLLPRETGREPLVDEETGEPAPSGPDPVSASLNGHSPVRGAMAVAMTTARAKVGAKVRAAVMSDQELRERIDGIPNEDVVFVLGGEVAEARVDVNQAVLDGLAGFRTWWTQEMPGPANPTVATNLFAIWVANTLDHPTTGHDIPDRLVDEVTSGRLKKGATSAA